jgi:serine/threonine protein kinase
LHHRLIRQGRWALGVLVHELRAGRTPFKAKDEVHMFQNILRGKYTMPSHLTDAEADFVRQLLQVCCAACQ